MRYLVVGLMATIGLYLPGEAQVTLTMSDVMTPSELEATGVSGLTEAQRRALDQWLQRYTLRVLEVAQGAAGQTSAGGYAGLGSGHWVREKVDGGEIIILEDGSMWEISSIDRIYTRLWLRITNITVLEASDPVGPYRYWLINTDDGERVLAKYLGKG